MTMDSAPMQQQWSIYYNRLERFLSNNYFPETNIAGQFIRIKSDKGIKLYKWSPSDQPKFSDALNDANYQKYSIGETFGPSWSTHWFRVEISSSLLKEKDARFYWKSQGEGLVWRADGFPVHGLSPQDRSDFPLRLVGNSDDSITFYIEMACLGLFGNGTSSIIDPPDETRRFCVEECDIRVFNDDARNLYADLQIIKDIANNYGEKSPVGKRALYFANQIINTFNHPACGDSMGKCQRIANEFLRGSPQSMSKTRVLAVGNCHIDTAWLWRYDETRRKTARSWSSQIALMEVNPGYIFVASQMQQLEWLKNDYPKLFKKLQDYHEKGQFIPIGGSWVEMDGNLPSGESFARQFLYGQKFLLEHFGSTSEIFWLPDTFGYNCQLPQLMKEAGINYFVSTKLSWNNINKFPHSSFWWEGLDGSRVLTHFPPNHTYTSQATASEVIKNERENHESDRSQHSLLLFGHGDGGGGPTEEMINRLKRMCSSPGLPRVVFASPLTFFKALKEESNDFLSWRGELYFELHRGTYTSQARTKYYNRRCETFLREAEMLSVINGIISNNTIGRYPKSELETLWKNVLLNQFHDVLPGSSIGSVYDDSNRLYEHVEYHAVKIRDSAMNNLFGNKHNCPPDLYPAQHKSIVFFNTTAFERDEVLTVPYDGEEDSPQSGVLAVTGIKGFSMASFDQSKLPFSKLDSTKKVSITQTNSHYMMENGYVRVKLDQSGHVISFLDKELNREIMLPGEKGNKFMMYEDIPYYWDAWDVELYHLEKGWCVSEENVQLSVGMEGPLLVSLLRVIKISPQSKIAQVISLSLLSKRLDFTTRIEWHESHKCLKVEFPVDIRSDIATFECPFGMITRPTHWNTSWDMAKFEVCGHRFADLSEYDYGIALLNDCKYGHSVRHTLMQLTLLRSPKMPDPECDMGTHVMKFALFPHFGNVVSGKVLEEAIKFNTPLLWTSASSSLYDERWLNKPIIQLNWWNKKDSQVTPPNPLIIEAIKVAEDSSGDVIIRAYEARGGRGVAVLECHEFLKILSAKQCDILEMDRKNEGKINSDPTFRFDSKTSNWLISFTPFQILTIRLKIIISDNVQSK